MSVALVNTCVDPRLDHAAIRLQIAALLKRAGLAADRIFITADVGGNLGTAFANTLDMLANGGQDIVLTAVLHHDDCVAHNAGLRQPLEDTVAGLEILLASRALTCPVYSGHIHTGTNEMSWSSLPRSLHPPAP